MITAKFGYRYYEFNDSADVTKATAIWVKPGDQQEFEAGMEKAGIDFAYDLLEYYELDA